MNHADNRTPPPALEDHARACLEGDERAYRDLVERLLPDAMALAIQFVRRRESAEDAVQDAFLRMARSLPTYDPNRPFAPWFFTIVRNCARTHAARTRRRRDGQESVRHAEWLEPVAGPDEGGLDSALDLDLARAVALLPRMQQRCVRLCLFEGYTSTEAALLLGVREGTVRTHVKRARSRLQSVLGGGSAR